MLLFGSAWGGVEDGTLAGYLDILGVHMLAQSYRVPCPRQSVANIYQANNINVLKGWTEDRF